MKPKAALPRPRYRWIVTDLDGTLVDRQLAMVPKSRQALLAYQESGGQIVIATGRNAVSAKRFYDELELTGPAILLNGALVMNLRTGQILLDTRFASTVWSTLREQLDRMSSHRTAVVVFAGAKAYTMVSSSIIDSFVARDRLVVERIDRWDTALRSDEISKVMVLTTTPDVAASVVDELRRSGPPVTIIMSEPTYVELLPEGSDKGSALRWLADHAGMPLAEVAAVGDNPNDLPMLLVAGLGAAVGDGHADVRSAAAIVVGPCTDGAVADVVCHIMAR